MSITKRESGNATVFEALNGGVIALYAQGTCYIAPICTPGLKQQCHTTNPSADDYTGASYTSSIFRITSTKDKVKL